MREPEPAGEEGTPAELAEKYHRWACRKAVAFHRSRSHLDLADLFGVAGLALCRAAKHYRREFGVPFCGYASAIIERHLRRHAIVDRRRGLTTRAGACKGANYRTDLPEVHGLEAASGRGSRSLADPFREDVWEMVRGLLGSRDYEMIVARFRDGEEYHVIAERYGVRRQRVHQIVHRALRVLRAYPQLAEMLE